jgi:glycosyltransferase involved in cell wall biosynthesis
VSVTSERQLPGYVIVSPVRDEARFLERTAASIAAQTHQPLEWLIVDDGSTDDTPQIAALLAQRHPWIRVTTRTPKAVEATASAGRVRGAPVVLAFNDGLAAARTDGEFVVKLDADLYLPSHYFEWVAATFEREPQTGICGGLVVTDYGDAWRLDTINRNTVSGAIKSYRRECLAQIGGLRPSMGWDGIDEYAARARGWDVHALSELLVLHYRPRGSKQRWLKARWEEGHGCHYMGYRWSFMLLRAVYRMLVDLPPLAGGVVIGAGFAWNRLRRSPQVPDELALRQLRRDQAARLRNLLLMRRQASRWPTSAGPAHTLFEASIGLDEPAGPMRDG